MAGLVAAISALLVAGCGSSSANSQGAHPARQGASPTTLTVPSAVAPDCEQLNIDLRNHVSVEPTLDKHYFRLESEVVDQQLAAEVSKAPSSRFQSALIKLRADLTAEKRAWQADHKPSSAQETTFSNDSRPLVQACSALLGAGAIKGSPSGAGSAGAG